MRSYEIKSFEDDNGNVQKLDIIARNKGFEVRTVLEIGKTYVVQPDNKNKKKHRDRQCVITGFRSDDLGHAFQAAVKFTDTQRAGRVDIEDLKDIVVLH